MKPTNEMEVFVESMMQVLPQVVRGIMRRETHALAKGQVTAPQFFVLAVICCQGAQNMSALAEELRVSLPAMTGLINRLCKMKVVKRIYKETDRRVILIDITSKGKRLIEAVHQQKRKSIIDLFGQLPKKDREDYLRILKKIKNILAIVFVGITMLLSGYLRPCFAQESLRGSKLEASVTEVSQIALKNNIDIQIAKYDSYIKRTDLESVNSLFDTVLNAKWFYLNDQKKSSSALLGTKSVSNDFFLGLSKKISTGTTLGVSLEAARNSTNSAFAAVNPSHEAAVKISIHQPIGKNFFGLIDRGIITLTKLEVERFDYTALDRIEQSLYLTQQLYWGLVLQYHELGIAIQMLKRAQDLYTTYQDKHALGLVEEAELFAAKANVTNRQAGIITIKHNVLQAKNELLLSLQEGNLTLEIIPLDSLITLGAPVSLEESLRIAMCSRRDYQGAKNDVEAKKINLSMKKNNVWPQIDLDATYLHNGLETSKKKAWSGISSENNPEWYTGISASIALENSAAISEKRKAQLEKSKALLQLKKIEHAIVVDISNKVDALNTSLKAIGLRSEVVVLQKKKLEFEEQRFNAGRSNTDILIRYQEDLLNAQLAYAREAYDYQVSIVEWKLSQNVLLDEFWQGKL